MLTSAEERTEKKIKKDSEEQDQLDDDCVGCEASDGEIRTIVRWTLAVVADFHVAALTRFDRYTHNSLAILLIEIYDCCFLRQNQATTANKSFSHQFGHQKHTRINRRHTQTQIHGPRNREFTSRQITVSMRTLVHDTRTEL